MTLLACVHISHNNQERELEKVNTFYLQKEAEVGLLCSYAWSSTYREPSCGYASPPFSTRSE
jgi:hypothetical protein